MNLIIFVGFPVTIRDKERYGIEYLSLKGYNLYIFDFTDILLSKVREKRVIIPDEIKEVFIKRIKVFKDFKDILNSIEGKKIVLAHQYPHFSMEKYYGLLHKLHIPIYLFSGGHHPADYIPKKINRKIKIIKQYIADPASLVRRLFYKIFRRGPILPKKIFINCNKAYEGYRSTFGPIDNVVVPVHTLDYDSYIKAKNKKLAPDNTCVFLDENVGINHDEQITGKTPKRLSLEAYYSSMNKFFDYIEEKTGLHVVIAESPRSDYRKNLNIFGSRPIIKYKSAELVSKSSLVILHGTTSFNYAVLFKKPVIFITTSELTDVNKSPSYTFTSALADAVGQKVINIDEPREIQSIDFSSLSYNEELYERYIQDYISFRKVDERFFWEIVDEEIKKDNT